MSLDLARDTDREHPVLLLQNTNATCYQFVVYLIAKLRSSGHSAYHVCKTQGEGQYTPPGFVARSIVGLDGRGYLCTGVSHDALWCNGLQFDTVGRGNDSPDPIFEANGNRITGVPTWVQIPKEHWRASNPPLLIEGAPLPEQPRLPVLPKGEAFAALKALHAFYAAPEGLQRPEGIGGDMEAIAQWFYQLVIERKTIEDVKAQIRQSDEWRTKHP